jgi:hypothetical protein
MRIIKKVKIRGPILKGNNATYFYTGRFDEERREEELRQPVEEAEKILQEINTAELNRELWDDRARFELLNNG